LYNSRIRNNYEDEIDLAAMDIWRSEVNIYIIFILFFRIMELLIITVFVPVTDYPQKEISKK